MRRFYIALVMIAVATASFAVGRSTSRPATSEALAEKVASIDGLEMHSAAGDLPALHVESPY